MASSCPMITREMRSRRAWPSSRTFSVDIRHLHSPLIQPLGDPGRLLLAAAAGGEPLEVRLQSRQAQPFAMPFAERLQPRQPLRLRQVRRQEVIAGDGPRRLLEIAAPAFGPAAPPPQPLPPVA